METIKFIDGTEAVLLVRCKECKKSHVDGKTTHYLWCTEWGRSTDTFGYCERGEREVEPKDEPQTDEPQTDEPTWEQVKEYCNKRCLDIVDSALRKQWYKDEPQTDCAWK